MDDIKFLISIISTSGGGALPDCNIFILCVSALTSDSMYCIVNIEYAFVQMFSRIF